LPGTEFTGTWEERRFFESPEITRALHWKEPATTERTFAAANDLAVQLLAAQRRYAEAAGLAQLLRSITELESRLTAIRERGRSCLLCLGWGGGLLSKTVDLRTDADPYRQVLRALPYYNRAIQSGLPFPKTRKIVFVGDQPAALPGWCLLEVSQSH
jgi:CRISPR-associated protein Csm5